MFSGVLALSLASELEAEIIDNECFFFPLAFVHLWGGNLSEYNCIEFGECRDNYILSPVRGGDRPVACTAADSSFSGSKEKPEKRKKTMLGGRAAT